MKTLTLLFCLLSSSSTVSHCIAGRLFRQYLAEQLFGTEKLINSEHWLSFVPNISINLFRTRCSEFLVKNFPKTPKNPVPNRFAQLFRTVPSFFLEHTVPNRFSLLCRTVPGFFFVAHKMTKFCIYSKLPPPTSKKAVSNFVFIPNAPMLLQKKRSLPQSSQ